LSSTNPNPEPGWRRTVFDRSRAALDGGDWEDRASPGGRFALLAFLLLMASQTTRWGWWTDVGGHTQDVGYVGQSTDGLAGALAALALWLVIRARSGATSGFRVVQFLPLILGGACLLIGIGGYQQVNMEMLSHRGDLRPADLDAGVYLALLGAGLGLAGGVLATRARLRNPTHSDAPAISLKSVLPQIAAGAIGAPAWLAIWLGLGQIGGMWLGMFGIFLGPVVSLAVVRWVRGDGLSAQDRRTGIQAVPMDRLRDEGRTR
jgi:hypothetical protein